MSYVNEISNADARDHGYIHPMHFVGKINNCLKPWQLADMEFKPSGSGKMNMICYLIDQSCMGATRINTKTQDKEVAKGVKVILPLNGLLPTEDELEVFLESVRQDLGIAGRPKIITGKF